MTKQITVKYKNQTVTAEPKEAFNIARNVFGAKSKDIKVVNKKEGKIWEHLNT